MLQAVAPLRIRGRGGLLHHIATANARSHLHRPWPATLFGRINEAGLQNRSCYVVFWSRDQASSSRLESSYERCSRRWKRQTRN
jgi:hypothetical protein